MRAGACVAPRAKRNMSGSGAMILRSHTCPVKGFRRPHYEGSRASTKEQKTVAVLKVFDRTRKYQLGRSQKQLKKWLRGFTEWREAGHVGSNQNGWKPRHKLGWCNLILQKSCGDSKEGHGSKKQYKWPINMKEKKCSTSLVIREVWIDGHGGKKRDADEDVSKGKSSSTSQKKKLKDIYHVTMPYHSWMTTPKTCSRPLTEIRAHQQLSAIHNSWVMEPT